MIIEPPSTECEELEESTISKTNVDMERIKQFLDCINWKCIVCSSIVFGRCKNCPYCFGRNRIITPKPETV